MESYIGLDAHASSCTLAVVGPSGKRLSSHVVETTGQALIEVLRGIPRNRHMCLEEGTLSEWLHEVLEPHVKELVVAGVHKSRGPKSDKRDAFALAEQLRIGALETRVYKGRGKFRRLGCLARAHGHVVGDVVREEPAEERAALAGRRLRSRTLGLREGRPSALARCVAQADTAPGRVAVRRARRARGPEGESREAAAKGGTQAPGVANL